MGNSSKEKLSLQLKLDILLLYLRRVHSYCFYCGEEYEDERMLSTRCGPQHIRHHQVITEEEFDEILKSQEELKEDGEEAVEGTEASLVEKIAKLTQKSSSKWGGSITFLQKYVSTALNRIKGGPQDIVDPEQEYISKDIEDFLRYKCKEVIPGVHYSCDICEKKFTGQEYVIKHINNKHQDIVDETYERESTKDWLQRNIQQKLKKDMKQNYFKDENKLMNQPGRKYHANESSYYHQRDDQQGSGKGGYKGGRGQGQRGRGGFRYYVDYDDPKVNETNAKTKVGGRELVDYSDLFG